MATYIVEDPNTGRSVELTGDSEPTEQELEQVFTDMANQERSQAEMAGVQAAMSATPQGAAIARFGPNIAGMGIEAGMTTLAQAAGANPALSIPSRGLSVPVAGMIGAATGYELARRAEGRPFELGRFATTTAAGAIPGSQVATQTARQLTKTGVGQGFINVGLGNIQSLVDGGGLLSMGENATAFGTGMFGPVAGKAIGKVAGGAAVPIPEESLPNLGQSMTLRKAAARPLVNKGFLFNPNKVQGEGRPVASIAAGGDEVIEAAASEVNIPLSQKVVREHFGLAPNSMPITDELWDDLRKQASKPYEQVRSITESAKKRLADLKKNRLNAADPSEARIQEDLLNKETADLQRIAAADVDQLSLAQANLNAARKKWKREGKPAYQDYVDAKDELFRRQDEIEQAVKLAGKPKLSAELEKAKVYIRQAHVAQGATDPVAGIIEPTMLGQLAKKREYMTGPLRQLADAAEQFPGVFQPLRAAPRPEAQASLNQMGRDAAMGNAASGLGLSLRRTVGAPVRELSIFRKDNQKRLVEVKLYDESLMNPAAVFTRFGVQTAGRNEAASE